MPYIAAIGGRNRPLLLSGKRAGFSSVKKILAENSIFSRNINMTTTAVLSVLFRQPVPHSGFITMKMHLKVNLFRGFFALMIEIAEVFFCRSSCFCRYGFYAEKICRFPCPAVMFLCFVHHRFASA